MDSVFRHSWVAYLVLAVAVISLLVPALASSADNPQASSDVTVTLEVISSIAIDSDGNAYSSSPVTIFVDEDNGIITYSAIDS